MPFLSEKDQANLFGILDCIENILNFSNEHLDAESFYKDRKTFDAVLMNFIVIGEAVVRLSDSIKENNQQIAWIKIKSIRNIIAHDYFGVNPEIVWQIVQEDIPDLKQKVAKIL